MKIWNDPERWVDSDMQRDEWLLLFKQYGLLLLGIAAAITLVVVLVGVALS